MAETSETTSGRHVNVENDLADLRGSAHGTRGSAGPPAANSIKELRHRDAAHLERMIGTAT